MFFRGEPVHCTSIREPGEPSVAHDADRHLRGVARVAVPADAGDQHGRHCSRILSGFLHKDARELLQLYSVICTDPRPDDAKSLRVFCAAQRSPAVVSELPAPTVTESLLLEVVETVSKDVGARDWTIADTLSVRSLKFLAMHAKRMMDHCISI